MKYPDWMSPVVADGLPHPQQYSDIEYGLADELREHIFDILWNNSFTQVAELGADSWLSKRESELDATEVFIEDIDSPTDGDNPRRTFVRLASGDTLDLEDLSFSELNHLYQYVLLAFEIDFDE